MKRHQALRDYSRDHLFALRAAHKVEQAVRGLKGGPSLSQAALHLARTWDPDLIWHFREEEEILLPRAMRHIKLSRSADLQAMLEDHAWLRGALMELAEQVPSACPVREELAELGRRLHDHIRLEERRIFPAIEKMLSEDELAGLGRASRGFRLRWRSSEVIGPFRTHG